MGFAFCPIVQSMRRRAEAGMIAGRDRADDERYLASCSRNLLLDPWRLARVIYTREISREDGRCSFHLSLSFRDMPARPRPFDHQAARILVSAFFQPNELWLVIRPPSFPPGRLAQAWHFRMMANADWQPVLGGPRHRKRGAMTWPAYLERVAA